VPDIGGGGPLLAGAEPLRIGQSALLSFSPLGSATAGTLYVSASAGPQMAIRITGPTGRVRVLRFDRGAGSWQP
jgi:hypothetical protein